MWWRNFALLKVRASCNFAILICFFFFFPRPGSVIVSSSSYFSNVISTSYVEEEEDYLNAFKTDVENQLIDGVVNNGVLGPLADGRNSVLLKQRKFRNDAGIVGAVFKALLSSHREGREGEREKERKRER